MPTRRHSHDTRSRTGLAVAVALLLAVGGFLSVVGPAASGDKPAPEPSPPAGRPSGTQAAAHPRALPGAQPSGRLGAADGEVPDGITVFDDRLPAVTNLDPTLLDALRAAGTDAKGDGVELVVNSGWRSTRYQAQLLDEAIATYGSRKKAARWVATPATSPHVSGDAVDLGPTAADAWLSEHGAAYGLCQIYANEPWHYELRPDAEDSGCPRSYADPTHDPRMQ